MANGLPVITTTTRTEQSSKAKANTGRQLCRSPLSNSATTHMKQITIENAGKLTKCKFKCKLQSHVLFKVCHQQHLVQSRSKLIIVA